MGNIGNLVGLFAAGLGLLVVLAAGYVVVRSSILKQTNEVLVGALDVERNERRETEARCREEVAQLRGQVHTLTRQHAEVIAREVIRVFRDDGVLPPPPARPGRS